MGSHYTCRVLINTRVLLPLHLGNCLFAYIVSLDIVICMHSSAIFQAPPNAVDFLKVYHKKEVCFHIMLRCYVMELAYS